MKELKEFLGDTSQHILIRMVVLLVILMLFGIGLTFLWVLIIKAPMILGTLVGILGMAYYICKACED